MLNFGFENLILVSPRDDWPNEYAIKAAAGAINVIEKAKVFKNLEDALSQFNFVFSSIIDINLSKFSTL